MSTFAPKSITDGMAVLVAHGFGNSGIVGDAAHAKTGGYHEGRTDLRNAGVLATDYSVRTARDRAGLSEAASALDLTRGHNTAAALQSFSRNLVAACQANRPGTSDIREVIYSPDGKVVRRWDHVSKKVYVGGDGTGQGDNTHLWHTHISFYRDAEARSKAPVFAALFPSAGPTPAKEPDMIIARYLPGHVATVKPTANVRTDPAVTGTLIRAVTAAETWEVIGCVTGGKDADNADPATNTLWYVRWAGGKFEYTAFSNVTAIKDPVAAPVDTKPLTDEIASLKAQLAQAGQAAAAAQNAAAVAEGQLSAWNEFKAAHQKVGL